MGRKGIFRIVISKSRGVIGLRGVMGEDIKVMGKMKQNIKEKII